MKKIIEKCNECPAFKIYGNFSGIAKDGAVVCEKEMRVIGHITSSNLDCSEIFSIPDWCPLKTFAENNDAFDKSYKTVILDDLEWMTENIAEHGGIELNGNYYYTCNQAKKIVEEVGDGWRLPTENEFKHAVTKIDSNRLWSESSDIMYLDKEKNLFLEALTEYNFGYERFSRGKNIIYWTTPDNQDVDTLSYSIVYRNGYLRAFTFNTSMLALPVRLVRDPKK